MVATGTLFSLPLACGCVVRAHDRDGRRTKTPPDIEAGWLARVYGCHEHGPVAVLKLKSDPYRYPSGTYRTAKCGPDRSPAVAARGGEGEAPTILQNWQDRRFRPLSYPWPCAIYGRTVLADAASVEA
jgi:hypothetical protein